VGADCVAGGIEEDGLGGLKDPLGRAGDLLAGVDLCSFACSGENSVLRWRWCGGTLRLRDGSQGKCCGEEAVPNLHGAQKFIVMTLRMLHFSKVSLFLRERQGHEFE
jgi:hypothetical protein